MYVIKHQSNLFYTFCGKTPHVPFNQATRFPSMEAAQKVATIINQAGRGVYTPVFLCLQEAA